VQPAFAKLLNSWIAIPPGVETSGGGGQQRTGGYRYFAKCFTTTDMAPGHPRAGRKEVARIRGEMEAIKQVSSGHARAVLHVLRTDPKFF
jgi:uncharacterized protein (DUF885 family)